MLTSAPRHGPSRPASALVSLAAIAAVMSGCGVVPGVGPAVVAVPAELRSEVRGAGRECPGVPARVIAAQLDQESGWDRRAVSRAGAQGIAQFMPETWAHWGRDLDGDGVADPFDPAEAIDAQGRLMCHLHRQAQTSGLPGPPLELALAAYNAGWGPVATHRGIPPYPETRAYVREIMAARERVVWG